MNAHRTVHKNKNIDPNTRMIAHANTRTHTPRSVLGHACDQITPAHLSARTHACTGTYACIINQSRLRQHASMYQWLPCHLAYSVHACDLMYASNTMYHQTDASNQDYGNGNPWNSRACVSKLQIGAGSSCSKLELAKCTIQLAVRIARDWLSVSPSAKLNVVAKVFIASIRVY